MPSGLRDFRPFALSVIGAEAAAKQAAYCLEHRSPRFKRMLLLLHTCRNRAGLLLGFDPGRQLPGELRGVYPQRYAT